MVAAKQTRLKIRRGFVKVPLTYRILAVDQLSDKDKRFVTKTLVKVKTDADAKKLVGIGSKWGYKPLAYKTDRVAEITYKGIVVSLMYKRVTLMLQPLPEDPIPEGTLENPDDVWQRHDLFGVSVRQQHKIVRTEVESQENEAKLLQIELDAKDKIIAGLQKQVKSQQTIIAKKLQESIQDTELSRYVRATVLEHENELAKAAKRRKTNATN
jgi:hypothetical protein